jgi:hypothetical protein
VAQLKEKGYGEYLSLFERKGEAKAEVAKGDKK